MPESEDDSEELDRLTLTIVVASVVVGVLLAVLLVTLCGCCWLQNRSPPTLLLSLHCSLFHGSIAHIILISDLG